jgi:hypothetical protein
MKFIISSDQIFVLFETKEMQAGKYKSFVFTAGRDGRC